MQIRLNSTLRQHAGQRTFDIDLPENADVRRALTALMIQAPSVASLLLDEEGNLQPGLIIFRNGRNIEFFDGLTTPLRATDTVDIFPKTGAQRVFAKQ